jgi:DNA-binding MarR family transcriptional regulator
VSRQSRGELEAQLGLEVRGWQVDQDLFDDAIAQLAGMNRTDMRCLDIVGQQGPMTAGQLARAARLTSGAVTAVLDRLEAAGLVRRSRDSGDRRRVMVEVTPRMEEESAEAFSPFLADAAKDVASYTDDQLAFLVNFLRRNRSLLVRHTTRFHEMLAGRK